MFYAKIKNWKTNKISIKTFKTEAARAAWFHQLDDNGDIEVLAYSNN